MIDANVKGVLCCTHAVLPGMVARDRGHIVNVGSVAGNSANPGSCVYGSTKAFVHRFSEEPARRPARSRCPRHHHGAGRRRDRIHAHPHRRRPDRGGKEVRRFPRHVFRGHWRRHFRGLHLAADGHVNQIEIMSIDQAAGPRAFSAAKSSAQGTIRTDRYRGPSGQSRPTARNDREKTTWTSNADA